MAAGTGDRIVDIATAAETIKMTQLNTLMEKLRAKHNQPKHWADTLKTVRQSLERRAGADGLQRLSRCLETLQKALKVTSPSAMVSQLETIAQDHGLSSHYNSTNYECYITSDMFYMMIQADGAGTICDIKVAHHGENPVSCPDLTSILRVGDFSKFSNHLEALASLYTLPGDSDMKNKMYLALQSLEMDLLRMSQLYRMTTNGSTLDCILHGNTGHLTARCGEYLTTLKIYVSPSDLIDETCGSTVDLTDDHVPRSLGLNVTVAVEGVNGLYRLPIVPLVMGNHAADEEGTPPFAAISPANSVELPACFVLRCQIPIPVSESTLQRISAITVPRSLGLNVTVAVEGVNGLYRLPIVPLVMGNHAADEEGTPPFAAISPANSVELPACFVLRCQIPIPVSESTLQRISAITGITVPVIAENSSMLGLIQQSVLGKVNEGVCYGRYHVLNLPGQQHCYFLNTASLLHNNKEFHGGLISKIPFVHPSHVPPVLALLRQQLVFNTLLGSCVRGQPLSWTNQLSKRIQFEISPVTDCSFTFSFQHPKQDSLLSVLVEISNHGLLSGKLFTSPVDGPICGDDYISQILQRCVSLPVTMRALYKKAESAPVCPVRPSNTAETRRALAALASNLSATLEELHKAHAPPTPEVAHCAILPSVDMYGKSGPQQPPIPHTHASPAYSGVDVAINGGGLASPMSLFPNSSTGSHPLAPSTHGDAEFCKVAQNPILTSLLIPGSSGSTPTTGVSAGASQSTQIPATLNTPTTPSPSSTKTHPMLMTLLRDSVATDTTPSLSTSSVVSSVSSIYGVPTPSVPTSPHSISVPGSGLPASGEPSSPLSWKRKRKPTNRSPRDMQSEDEFNRQLSAMEGEDGLTTAATSTDPLKFDMPDGSPVGAAVLAGRLSLAIQSPQSKPMVGQLQSDGGGSGGVGLEQDLSSILSEFSWQPCASGTESGSLSCKSNQSSLQPSRTESCDSPVVPELLFNVQPGTTVDDFGSPLDANVFSGDSDDNSLPDLLSGSEHSVNRDRKLPQVNYSFSAFGAAASENPGIFEEGNTAGHSHFDPDAAGSETHQSMPTSNEAASTGNISEFLAASFPLFNQLENSLPKIPPQVSSMTGRGKEESRGLKRSRDASGERPKKDKPPKKKKKDRDGEGRSNSGLVLGTSSPSHSRSQTSSNTSAPLKITIQVSTKKVTLGGQSNSSGSSGSGKSPSSASSSIASPNKQGTQLVAKIKNTKPLPVGAPTPKPVSGQNTGFSKSPLSQSLTSKPISSSNIKIKPTPKTPPLSSSVGISRSGSSPSHTRGLQVNTSDRMPGSKMVLANPMPKIKGLGSTIVTTSNISSPGSYQGAKTTTASVSSRPLPTMTTISSPTLPTTARAVVPVASTAYKVTSPSMPIPGSVPQSTPKTGRSPSHSSSLIAVIDKLKHKASNAGGSDERVPSSGTSSSQSKQLLSQSDEQKRDKKDRPENRGIQQSPVDSVRRLDDVKNSPAMSAMPKSDGRGSPAGLKQKPAPKFGETASLRPVGGGNSYDVSLQHRGSTPKPVEKLAVRADVPASRPKMDGSIEEDVGLGNRFLCDTQQGKPKKDCISDVEKDRDKKSSSVFSKSPLSTSSLTFRPSPEVIDINDDLMDEAITAGSR
uniref:mediator of RNA polymerase II transcription subunit 1-like n=1 Tax=Myxine glutinosa TaxID=7769 RepID=UPI00358E2F5C